MTSTIDLNCDMGEGIATDELILPFISSANIACGYHAGDEKIMWQTIEGALKHKVAIGAHPSFFDKKNFGRTEMDMATDELYDLITQQLIILNEIAGSFDTELHHVKPHGALYNMSARNADMARTVARAVKDFDEKLILFGLSGSHSIKEAKAISLKTSNEVFADRSYQEDGSLTPRSQPGAMIEDIDKAVEQVMQMIRTGTVTTLSGKSIPMIADTVCIHGDGKYAVEFAKGIYDSLKRNNIEVKKVSGEW